MNTVENHQTEHEIQRQALQALRNSLGVVGLIRFMQQYDKGFGNYTLDRSHGRKPTVLTACLRRLRHDSHHLTPTR